LEFAKHDKRGGTKPIIHHQNVGFMLANMKMRIEAARYMVWRACHWVDNHQADGTEMPVLAKVFCSEIAVEICRDALYLMGVNGYVRDHPIERHLRDALGLPISDAGNMGVRRRQLHGLLLHPDYDPNAIVNNKFLPFDKLQASEV
jgi:alkylation response protein AidB-like acyl-CoA dehydrogenase